MPTIEPVTAVTPEILAMTWASMDAARVWFKRRSGDLDTLGLELKEFPSTAGLRVRAVTATPKAGPDPALFEDWATEVDGLLGAANEEPETDEKLEDLFGRGCSVQHAFDEIVAHRMNALEQAEAGGAAEGVGAEFPTSEEQAATLGEDPDEVIQGGTVDFDEPAIVEGAEHPGVTIIRTGNLEGEAQVRAEAMLAQSIAPVEAPVTEAAGDGVALTSTAHPFPAEDVFLADLLWTLDSTELSVAEIVTTAAKITRARIAARAGELSKAQDAISGVVEEPAQDATQETPETAQGAVEPAPQAEGRLSRAERQVAIREALETKEGVSAKEIQAILGWENMPNPWHFRAWAKQMDRMADLTDMGIVNGQRRWKLLVRRR